MERDRLFTGPISVCYERYLVPLIFEPYASDLSSRVAALAPARVLEIAAGTGVLTRALARALPTSASITATDLNPGMLQQASLVGTSRPVTWRQADAMELPFRDGTFDVVVCQFGVMFFPDKGRAFREAHRVLKAGGTLLFSVWDRIEDNEFADVVTSAVGDLFPADPPRFLARTPHGYFDQRAIAEDLERGGFGRRAEFATVTERSRADSSRVPAIAYCHGTPMRNEIELQDPARLEEATAVAADAIRSRFGGGAVDGKIQAHVVCSRT